MATAFAFRQPFPFCPQEISGSVPSGTSYLDNLTLAEVMDFAWNLETFTLTSAGSATDGTYTADGSMNFTLAPIASSRFDVGNLEDGSMWYGDAFGDTSLGSWPSIREPRDRVCHPTQTVTGCLFQSLGEDTGGSSAVYEVGFWVGTDPSNAGRYRLYYDFSLAAFDGPSSEVGIRFTNVSSIGGYSVVNSGTFTIGTLSFNWYCHISTGASGAGTFNCGAVFFYTY